jgi:hypothetical protein
LAQKIFKNKYKSTEYEKLANEVKAATSERLSRMRLVFGKDINKWYNESMYARVATTDTTLGNSCMRQPSRNKFMNFYSKNSNNEPPLSKVGLLILLNDNDQLIGRAVVWFNSIKPYKGYTFMDRIYTVDYADINLFKNYAKEKRWLYKEEQSYSNSNWVDPKDGRVHKTTLTFRIQKGDYDYYPYVDTLQYYTPETGRISSQLPATNKFRVISLRSTGGGYSNVSL